MRVKELMSKKVQTVGPEDFVDKVVALFHFEAIRHLPVIEKGKVVGIVSDRDVKKILGSRKRTKAQKEDPASFAFPGRKVRTLMHRGLLTIGPEEKASDAAAIMAKKKIGCLPVVEKGKLVGILTASDILRAFVKLATDVQKWQKTLAKLNLPVEPE